MPYGDEVHRKSVCNGLWGAKRLEKPQTAADCIKALGYIALARSDHYGAARARYEQGTPLNGKVGNMLGEASWIKGLGDIKRAANASRRSSSAL